MQSPINHYNYVYYSYVYFVNIHNLACLLCWIQNHCFRGIDLNRRPLQDQRIQMPSGGAVRAPTLVLLAAFVQHQPLLPSRSLFSI